MTGRTIAIGDIHGCAAALEILLAEIQPTEQDTIVTLGDYVDRGPDSRRVLELLLALDDRCRFVPLKGNHELMLLSALESPAEMNFWLYYGGEETAASYGGVHGIPEEHLEFLRDCRTWHETSGHIFVHANYDPDLPLEEQPESLTFWEHLGNPPPGPHASGKTVVVGHTPQVSGNILDAGHVVCIDTYCFGDGYLTAWEVETGQLWQADKEGTLRQR